MMVLEYLHASLAALLENHPNLPLHFKERILLDVTVGLRFLHERKHPIIHRDLTTNNVLVTEDLRAKISDLGMARILPTSLVREMTTAPGNIHFMPPEALTPDPVYDVKLDMFSLGVVILHVVLQTWPSPNKASTSMDPLKGLIAHSEVERRTHHFRKMDSGQPLTQLAESCLNNSPESRPSAKEAHSLLQPLVMHSSHLFSSSLESFRRQKEVEEKNRTLKSHSQDVESQMHKILQDVYGKDVLCESEVRELIEQLRSIVRDTRSILYSSDQVSYDYTLQHRLVVAYKIPSSSSPSMLSSSSSSSSTSETNTTDMLRICSLSPQNMHPVSLTLHPPVNHTFSGTYVKTVISGLSKSFGVAVNNDQLYVVDNLGWNGVHICNITDSETTTPTAIIESASSMEVKISGMPLEKCWGPSGVAIDGEKNIILADMCSHRVVKFSPDGTFLHSSGKLLEYGSDTGEFNKPIGVCVSRKGDIYVCDLENHRILVLNSNLRSQQEFGKYGKGQCEFHHPRDVAFDSKKNMYVVDCSNYCVKVFSPDFQFLRKIGREGKEVDQFRSPSSLCIDRRDYVYVTDRSSNCVKVFDPSGKFVMSFGGDRDGREEFKFNKPMGIAIDNSGNVFVSDSYNGRVLMFE